MRFWRTMLLAAALTAPATLVHGAAASAPPAPASHARLLTAGLQGSVGSTLGPDGALYIAEGVAGRISRVDRRTGDTTTWAGGLPQRVVPGLGGAIDIAFLHRTAYVLVTLVGPDVGGDDTVGIYRVDGPHTFTPVADIGAYSIAHPPDTDFDVPSGLQYAMQPYRNGFLVTDGHHNRLLHVTLDGRITQIVAVGNDVPTGLTLRHGKVIMAEAGPVPHLPQDGRVVAIRPGKPRAHTVRLLASGAPLLVDVETGPRNRLYALSQGRFTPGGEAGAPADPDTGTLNRVERNGTLTPIATTLDQPTSLEIIGRTAYVVTLTGEVWTIERAC